MTRTLVLVPLALLLFPACGGDDDSAADAGVDAYAAPPPSEDWTRDILHTAIQADVSTLASTAVITLAASASTGASFDVGDLEISAIRNPDGPLEYQRDGAVLHVGVPAGATDVELTFEYKYRYHSSFQGASVSGYTLTWPYYCGNLFPCKSASTEGSTYELDITGVPEGSVAVYPESIPTNAPAYMLAWAVGPYTRIDLGTTTNGTQVAVWHFPDRADQAIAGTEYVRDAVDWMEQTYGDYAFGDTIGAVEAGWAGPWSGGMEHHPFWHIDMPVMTSDATHLHEAVHGWFGNGVRITCWEEYVLSEGPAEYISARAMAEAAGPLHANQLWNDMEYALSALQSGEENKIAWPDSCGELDIIDDGIFGAAPYVKGGLFFRALERRVGIEALDGALAAFLAEYMGQAARMQDLLDTIQTETGYDPTACANAWLRSEDAPTEFTCPEN